MKKYIAFILAILSGIACASLTITPETPSAQFVRPTQPDFIEVQAKEDLILSEKIYTLRYIADPDDVRRVATKVAQKYKIDPGAFICMIMKESGLNGKRTNGQYKCGDNGASCGLTQIQCPTWQSIRRHMGADTDCSLVHDDYENLETAAYGVSTYWPEHWTGLRLCRSEGYNFQSTL